MGHAGDTPPRRAAPSERAERSLASGPGRERVRSGERARPREQQGRLRLQAGGDSAEVQCLLPAAWDPQTLESALAAPGLGRAGRLQDPAARGHPRQQHLSKDHYRSTLFEKQHNHTD